MPNVDPHTDVRCEAVPYKVLMKFRSGEDPAQLKKPCFGGNGGLMEQCGLEVSP